MAKEIVKKEVEKEVPKPIPILIVETDSDRAMEFKHIGDLEKNITNRQFNIGKEIVSKVYRAAMSGEGLIDGLMDKEFAKELQAATDGKQKELIKKKMAAQKWSIKNMMEIWAAMSEVECETDILALIYIGKDEKKFKLETYKKRKVFFEDMPRIQVKEYEVAIQDFFSYMIPCLQEGIRTYIV